MITFHPADWAARQRFTPEQVDCTTAVVLKILDGKCKMLPAAQQAVVEIYGEIKEQNGEKLGNEVHQAISHTISETSSHNSEEIHRLRLHAEAIIPKPTMKRYKAMLAEAFERMSN